MNLENIKIEIIIKPCLWRLIGAFIEFISKHPYLKQTLIMLAVISFGLILGYSLKFGF